MGEHTDIMNWTRPRAWKLDWELRRGDSLIGTLSSPRLFGTGMSGTMGNEQFSLSKGGLRRPGAAVRRVQDDVDLAVLSFDSIGKGTVAFSNGSRYLLERQGPGDLWTLSREGGSMLFTVLRDTKSKYPSGRVEVLEEDTNLYVLLLLAWFIISSSEC